MRSVYLDNGATSYPKAPGVGEAMSDFITKIGCNIARGGYQQAYDAAGRVLEVRVAEAAEEPEPAGSGSEH